ncbi:MAG: hypothetical protein GY754_02695 [bacterium]|nr:hypothetical protein [bacterium]
MKQKEKHKEKQEKIKDALLMQKCFFNAKRSPNKDIDFQFNMQEPEGEFTYYLSIKNKTCELIEGRSPKPVCEIITDISTWEDIGGKYISPGEAVKSGRFKLKGNSLYFMLRYKKIFSGTLDWNIPGKTYLTPPSIEKIKNVLVLSCSPRGEKGATQFFADIFTKGMERAGAKVETLFPARMKINSCIGCFQCWSNEEKKCIYEEKDDMKIFWEKYNKADLLVWATPIYVFHGTSLMKKVVDRFFSIVNPNISVLPNGVKTHARKNEHIPYETLLACAGLNDKDVFLPLQHTLRTWIKYNNSKLLAELCRTNSMAFLSGSVKQKKMDEAVEALEQAGYELVTSKRVNKKTKKTFEQRIFSAPVFVSSANKSIDEVMRGEQKIGERKL